MYKSEARIVTSHRHTIIYTTRICRVDEHIKNTIKSIETNVVINKTLIMLN